ncbi:hypothetical protein [Clostridium beijerinckii]|uniref:hypothetical protein n=1 Tax=Clostridium beijerinckii TaxID=1520 RepID=UPI001360B87F|nr:hypothetical protein [Clostridium beijerinckii]MZK53503.1 hypothetical protein [Clostridium beijerinckii]MZK61641.1 hypothetical protein [Clostridium beijerinckii]MZK71866.1 hypothetical protein [Clostridium beijerinckii]MZK77270.1 hypothetical protein [Clostridium beijerinckii]MZK86349.1 hypothetical protein [Clostridium beijerinckii]
MEEKIKELENRIAALEEQVQPINKEVLINSLIKSLDASFSQLIENLKSANYGTCEEYTKD